MKELFFFWTANLWVISDMMCSVWERGERGETGKGRKCVCVCVRVCKRERERFFSCGCTCIKRERGLERESKSGRKEERERERELERESKSGRKEKGEREREYEERWGAGVETQKNVRGEIGGWGRVPFNEPYAPSLSTIYDGA